MKVWFLRPERATMSEPKRHHYLPQFYLRGFSREDFVWLYDRKTNQFRRQNPKNTAVIGHFYTMMSEDGVVDYGVEKMLSQLEGAVKPIIAKLESRVRIAMQERVDLAYFLGFLFSRVPKFQRETEEIADATFKLVMKGMVPNVEAATAQLRRMHQSENLSPESFYNFIHKEKYRLVGNRQIAIENMLRQGRKIAKDLALMDWLFVHAPSNAAFITTDSPLGFIIPEDVTASGEPALGAGSELITKIVPLSSRMALLIGKYGAGLGHASFARQQVRDLNILVATESERFVLGPDELLVRSVVKRSRVDTENRGTKMKVENIAHPNDPNRSFLVGRRVAPGADNSSFARFLKSEYASRTQ